MRRELALQKRICDRSCFVDASSVVPFYKRKKFVGKNIDAGVRGSKVSWQRRLPATGPGMRHETH